jgi:plasmid stabilization system protein ParE
MRMVRSAVRDAARFPRSHRLVPEFGEGTIRETFSGPYRIWYRIHDDEDRIEVIVVFHGSRQVPD